MIEYFAWIVLGAGACGSGRGPAIDAAGARGSLYLTVKDIDGRCGVTINGAGPFTSAQETLVDFDPGQTIPLTASAPTGVTLGLWHHTTHDTGSGEPGTISGMESSASVTLAGSPGCVWICCSSVPGDCPTAEQCP